MDTLIYIIIGIFTLWGIFIVAGGVWGQLYKDDNTEKGGKMCSTFHYISYYWSNSIDGYWHVFRNKITLFK
jgi:hypothetical protein